MATPLDVAERPATGGARTAGNLVEMNWDPITRIVGSLGIYTKDLKRNNRIKVVLVASERWCSSSRPGRYGAEC